MRTIEAWAMLVRDRRKYGDDGANEGLAEDVLELFFGLN
jgi:hypothetical protein